MFNKRILTNKKQMFLKKLVWMQMLGIAGGDLPWTTFTGNPLEFYAPKAHALKSCVVNISPVQDLHGYDSPWPAGGGKNKINVSDMSGSKTSVYYFDTPLGFQPEAGTTYTFSVDVTCSVSNYAVSIGCGSTSYQRDFSTKNVSGNQRVSITFTPTSTDLENRPNLFIRAPRFSSPTTFDYTLKNFQLELGSAATSYAPYANICPISGWTGANVYVEDEYDAAADPTVTVSWQSEAGTVYGGTLDVTTGLLTVDRAYRAFDGTEPAWIRSSSYNGSFYIATGLALEQNQSLNSAKCSHAVKATTFPGGYAFGKFGFDGQAASANFNVWIAAANTSLDDFKTYLSGQAQNGTPVSFVCELATPVTYQLTATEVDAIVGYNTMWTDCENLTVEAQARAIQLNTLQSLNMLMGGRYVNNHTEDDVSDDEALDIILGGNER